MNELLFINFSLIRGESHINFRTHCVALCHNDANKMTLHPLHMRHSQIFDKIDSFLKPVLNIFILRNLILGWGRWLLTRGLVFCIKSIDLGELLIVVESSIH